jgi:NTP pyrophosphatase (non-canonical NTP hydrolase)
MNINTLETQKRIADDVAARGYRTENEVAGLVKGLLKLLEETCEAAMAVDVVPGDIFWLVSDVANEVRPRFDAIASGDGRLYSGQEVGEEELDALKTELADVIITVLDLAEIIARYTGEQFDVIGHAILKSSTDINRGIR